jgi:hypothetical protein
LIATVPKEAHVTFLDHPVSDGICRTYATRDCPRTQAGAAHAGGIVAGTTADRRRDTGLVYPDGGVGLAMDESFVTEGFCGV